MNSGNPADRYGSWSIGMHWLMVLLLIAVYACINLREIYPKGSDPREALKAWHFMLGLSIFVLVFARLAIRAAGPTLPVRPEVRPWQSRAAGLVHVSLYVFMVVMPLLGWSILSAAGKPIPFFGFELPALLGRNDALAAQWKELHETIGTAGYYLIALHAGAALVHHYILRDNTLARMWPRIGKGNNPS